MQAWTQKKSFKETFTKLWWNAIIERTILSSPIMYTPMKIEVYKEIMISISR